MSIYSKEHINYLKKRKKNKIIILFFQIFIILTFLVTWELAIKLKLINSFLVSSPINVFNTLIKLSKNNNLFKHINITLNEVLISFFLTSLISFIIASIMWWNKNIAKIIDPYLTVLNALPKVALGPLIIIWIGANTNSIIFMALMISIFVTIINMYNSFINTDSYYITLLKTFSATKIQIFTKLIVPGNKNNIINCLKINISMNLIGVIMGELLVSKEGIGYLIMYGSQVFNINLVITGVILLAILSCIMYVIISHIEKKTVKNS